VRAALPGACLHVFGAEAAGAGVHRHQAPVDSRQAFVRGAILVVPLRVGSGIRMKILEAWARGVPVVATAAAAAGLEARDGVELLLAADGAEFAAALARLHREPGLATALTAGARALLRRRHDPAGVAEQLVSFLGGVSAGAQRA
jgi:polysaccharide biosynthesis protein PslH